MNVHPSNINSASYKVNSRLIKSNKDLLKLRHKPSQANQVQP